MDHWACRSPILSQLLVSSWANLINPRGTGGVGGGRGLRQRLRVLVKCAGSNAYVVKATEPQLWGVLFDSKLLFIPQTFLCPLTTSFLGWLETSKEWDLYFTRSPRKISRPLLIIKDSQTLLISKLFWGAPWISTSALLSIQAAPPKGWEQAGWHALGQKQPWNIYHLWNYTSFLTGPPALQVINGMFSSIKALTEQSTAESPMEVTLDWSTWCYISFKFALCAAHTACKSFFCHCTDPQDTVMYMTWNYLLLIFICGGAPEAVLKRSEPLQFLTNHSSDSMQVSDDAGLFWGSPLLGGALGTIWYGGMSLVWMCALITVISTSPWT